MLEQVLEGQPADIQAKQLLVDLAVNGGNWAEAQRLLEELASAEDPEARLGPGQLADVANIGLRDQELRRRTSPR